MFDRVLNTPLKPLAVEKLRFNKGIRYSASFTKVHVMPTLFMV